MGAEGGGRRYTESCGLLVRRGGGVSGPGRGVLGRPAHLWAAGAGEDSPRPQHLVLRTLVPPTELS